MRRITWEALGLSDKEHRVLNVLMQQSLARKISDISEDTHLPHATTSFILRKLEKRKLSVRIKQDNHFVWKYRKHIDLIENITSEYSKSSFIHVISGIKNIENEFLKILDIAPAERLFSIQGAAISKMLLKKIDEKFMYMFHREVRKHKIIIEGAVAESVFALFEKMSLSQLQSHLDRLTVVYVLSDDLIDFPLDIFIFSDRILLVDYATERLVHIEDRQLLLVFKSLLKIAEQYGRKIDLNRYLRELIDKKLIGR